MGCVKYLLAAAAASVISTAAFAADLPIAPPPAYAPPPVDFGGWYLRGDIGMSNQRVKKLNNVLYNAPGISVEHKGLGFDSATTFGVGVGYTFNNWLRGDITGEWRGKANLHGTDVVSWNGMPFATNIYSGSKSEWLILANAYVDLGTWWHVTPFVGAGIGMARNTISGFTDLGPQTASTAFGDQASKWNFAWALHAGLAYQVTPSLTVELAYRYVNLGDAITGDIYTYDGLNNVYNPMEFRDITSHDVKLGVRWSLNPVPAYLPPPPLVTKG